MYRYLVGSDENGWRVATAREFRAALPKGETIRRMKRRHWVHVRRWKAHLAGNENWDRGLARGRRCATADFTV